MSARVADVRHLLREVDARRRRVHLATDAVAPVGLDLDVPDHRARIDQPGRGVAAHLDVVQHAAGQQRVERRAFLHDEGEAVIGNLDELVRTALLLGADEQREPVHGMSLHRRARVREREDARAQVGECVDVGELHATLRRLDERIGEGRADMDESRSCPRDFGQHPRERLVPASDDQHIDGLGGEELLDPVERLRGVEVTPTCQRARDDVASVRIGVEQQHAWPAPGGLADEQIA